MKIRSIQVSAGRSIAPTKYIQCALRPQSSLTADLEEGDDALAKLKELHFVAENLLEDQVDELLRFAAARQSRRNKQMVNNPPQPAAENNQREPQVA